MDPARFTRVDPTTWRIEPHGAMRVPAIIYADEDLIRDMDDKVCRAGGQCRDAARHRQGVLCDAGCPLGLRLSDRRRGGVRSRIRAASFRPAASASTFPAACARCSPACRVADIVPVQKSLADSLFRQIPAGVGSKGAITLDAIEMDAMLAGGARWAVERGWGEARDLERIEEKGAMAGARPECVSERAKERQRREMGTLGSGNHYLEVQAVAEIFDAAVAEAFGLAQDDVVVTIHCGSRGLGHQIGTEFLKEMVVTREGLGHRASRSRARLRADPFGGRPTLSRRDAGGDQLRARQP